MLNLDLILIIGIALPVFLFLMGLYKTMFEKHVDAREKVKQLIAKQPQRTTHLQSSVLMASNNLPQASILRKKNQNKHNFLTTLEQDLERANLLIRGYEYVFICLGLGGLLFILSMLLFGQSFLMALLISIGGGFSPIVFLKVKIWLRMKKAGEQFADVLDALGNCFKTGFGFNRGIQTIAENFEDPWGTEFNKMAVETNLGATQDQVLNNLARRIPSTDVDLFVTAVSIQKETGGNMAEILSTLSKTVRERYKLYRKVSAISAQGKLSAGIVICVPFFLMLIMYAFLPKAMMDFVTNPVGIVLMIVAGFWMICGICVLFKIVQVEV